MDRSARVPAKEPISAMDFGHQTLKRSGSRVTGLQRITYAWSRVCPEFRIPRSSSLPSTKVSASSRSRVGQQASTVRYTAALEMLAARSARNDIHPRMVWSLLFPHRFSGEDMVRNGKVSIASELETKVRSPHSTTVK